MDIAGFTLPVLNIPMKQLESMGLLVECGWAQKG